MRIMHINSAKNWAGGEVHTHLVCKELVNRGFDVVLACRRNSDIGNVFERDGIKTFRLNLRNAIDIASSYQMAQYCRRQNIDIVHAHLGRDYWLAALIKFFYPEVKVIFTRHVLVPIKKSVFHRWVMNQASKIIAVSEAVKKVVLDSGIVKEKQVATIYNGIDVKSFREASPGILRTELQIKPNTKLVGIVGQVSPHKGQDFLVKSLPLVLEQYQDMKCIIIGSDFKNNQYIGELKVLAKSLELEKQVYFLGQRTDIPILLKDLDVFVLASQEEPFGLVVVEAMAAGVPVVATKCGGVLEIIADEETGVLVEYGDMQDLATAVLKLLNDSAMRERIIQNASNKASCMFSRETMVEELLKLYWQIGKE